jgi:hypothetical protein
VRIAEAIAGGDTAAAAAAAAAHVEMVGQLVLQAFLQVTELGTSTANQ